MNSFSATLFPRTAQSGRTQFLSLVRSLTLVIVGITATGTALARPGYDGSVTGWCAGRSAPKASLLSCGGCHALRTGGANDPTPLFTGGVADPTTSPLLNVFCKASSGGGGSASNSAPVFTPIADKNSTVGKKLSFKIAAKDPDGDPITLTADGQPLSIGATFDAKTKTFTWTPTADQVTAPSSPYMVTFTATDNQTPPLSGTATVNIYVNAAGTPTPPTGTDATVRAIVVKGASWNARTSTLVVKGKLGYTKGIRPTGLTVTIADDTGATLGTADVNAKGAWIYKDQSLSASPCGVQASIDTFTAQRKVSHSGCGVRPRTGDDDDGSDDSSEHSGSHD